MSKLKVLELFGGIGACTKALERQNIPHEVVDYVEIDRYAVKSYNAVHGTDFEPQDITKWDKDIEVDLIMHGSPCQDFSVAGKGAGGDEGSGTRSSLMYETLRIVEKLHPKYVIWENVKNLLSKKHRHNFDAYIDAMKRLGYCSHYAVLNAKDYGVPQNRERVFVVSVGLFLPPCWEFDFPEPMPLEKRLKDVLEKEVDEKYYLSDDKVKTLKFSDISKTVRSSGRGSLDRHSWDIVRVGDLDIKNHPKIIQRPRGKNKGGEHEISPTISSSKWQDNNYVAQPVKRRRSDYGKAVRKAYEKHEIQADEAMREYYLGDDGVMPTLTNTRREQRVAIITANKTGYDLAEDGDGIDLAYPESKTRRGRVGHAVSKTITTSDNMGVIVYDEKDLKSKDKRLRKIIERTSFKKGEVLNLDLYNQKTNKEVSQTLTDPCHNSQRLFDGYRIRKLTPKECWRLMGFDDADFEKAAKINSNTQLYKQAGNSIVVNVLEGILNNLVGGER